MVLIVLQHFYGSIKIILCDIKHPYDPIAGFCIEVVPGLKFRPGNGAVLELDHIPTHQNVCPMTFAIR